MRKTCLVFLHGSGGTGLELKSFLQSAPNQHFRFRTFLQVLDESQIELETPTAPYQYYAPMQTRTNVWFDRAFDFLQNGVSTPERIESINKALQQLLNLIVSLSASYDRILVGGFSMGGSLVLHLLRTQLPPNVIGLFSIGSFVSNQSIIYSSIDNLQIPLLMMHGESDDLIQLEWGRETATQLSLCGLSQLRFQTYSEVSHEISDEQSRDLLNWMQDLIHQHQLQSLSSSSSSSSSLSENRAYARLGRREEDGELEEEGEGGNGRKVVLESELRMGEIEKEERKERATRTNTHQSIIKGEGKGDEREEDSRGKGGGGGGEGGVSRLAEVTAEAVEAERRTTRGEGGGEEGKEGEGGEESLLPYSILSQSQSRHTLLFIVPKNMVPLLVSRPVLACGGMFEMREERTTRPPSTSTSSSHSPSSSSPSSPQDFLNQFLSTLERQRERERKARKEMKSEMKTLSSSLSTSSSLSSSSLWSGFDDPNFQAAVLSTSVLSSNPQNTASEIWKRLSVRISSEGHSLACPLS